MTCNNSRAKNNLIDCGWSPHSFSSVSSVAKLCPTICDPMDCSTPGFPVHHQPLEVTQTHVHWVCDAIQSSHPLPSPSLLAFNLFQHQGLFQSQFFASGGQSIQVSASASVLPMNISKSGNAHVPQLVTWKCGFCILGFQPTEDHKYGHNPLLV